MRAFLHHPRPGEPDVELLALGTSGGAIVSGCAWLGAGLPLPQCAFHTITGCPCPTCGATRCLVALLHGHVAEAIAWNPLAFVAIIAVALLNLYSAAVLAFGLPRIRISASGADAVTLRIAFVLLVALNWTYLIHHGV